MKKYSLFIVFFIIHYCLSAQLTPSIQWQNTIGGQAVDQLTSVAQTAEGGYILVGFSSSDSTGDKIEASLGGDDYWVIKIDTIGDLMWQNTIGGNGTEQLWDVKQTNDGGYVLAGNSFSDISVDKTEAYIGPFPKMDYWLIKLDTIGNIQWQNTIGGNDDDFLKTVQGTNDGGFILGGFSRSPLSGDKTEGLMGGYDYWVIKVDSIGNIIWQNTIGGNSSDELMSIQQCTDNGYILAGFSASAISGDKTELSLNFDYWVVKLDPIGNIVWQNTIGGSENEYLYFIEQTNDGGYILGGNSDSGISGDKTEPCIGNKDIWIVKLNTTGNIIWQNTIGGSSSDELKEVHQTFDGGYICGGLSYSGISGDKTEASNGSSDYWILKLDSVGNIVWQNAIGGNNSDRIASIKECGDGGYIFGGVSNSSISGDKVETSQGASDYWVVKLYPECFLPTITFEYTGDDTVCIDDGIQMLNGGSPAGGSYSGLGVSGTSFDPNIAGIGNHVISYTYINGINCSAADSVNIVVLGCAFVENTLTNIIYVYPNPFTHSISLSGIQTNTEIKLCNAVGQILENYIVPDENHLISMEQIKPGVYFLHINTKEGVIIEKIIKQ